MDDFTKDELDQLFAVFREQSLTIVEEMGDDILLLESKGEDEEVIARLRRAAHTIKGDSACIGLDGITELAHKIEDVIDAVMSRGSIFDGMTVDLILEGLDAIRSAVGGERVEDVGADKLKMLVGKLAAWEGDELVDLTLKQQEEKGAESEIEGGGHLRVPVAEEEKGGPGSVTKKRAAEYVRVEASGIDALLNLAGEMIIARSLMNEVSSELERELQKNEIVTRLNGASAQLGKLIAELQKNVLKMRMVTIDHVFRRFARPMRELAAERGKQVLLEVKGGETELDRTVVDLLYEPLLHLLRNSVDHGLETPEERRSSGKSATGSIKMSAYHEGNQVVVEVSDDGRGINADALKNKALERGAISAEQAEQMAPDDALELLFLAGLSTAKEITWVSGRGIGASTVKSAIEQLRGSINVRSELGIGTTFVLRMPLTLAIIKAILFNASGQLFALPLLAVSEIARIRAGEMVYVDGFESFRLRDRFVSLVRPGIVLGFDRRKGGSGAGLRAEAGHIFVIVLNVGDRKYGVVAESLSGEQELLIKPLESEWVQSESLAGASVLGDGRVVLIMDPGVLFRKALKYERVRGQGKGRYAQ